jgi:ABC-type transport system substrate-binding protein
VIERARSERDGRTRLELFHEADRMAVADQVAVIPLVYVRNAIVVKPWVKGWWEFGKSWSSFADLVVGEPGRSSLVN